MDKEDERALQFLNDFCLKPGSIKFLESITERTTYDKISRPSNAARKVLELLGIFYTDKNEAGVPIYILSKEGKELTQTIRKLLTDTKNFLP